MQKGKISLDYPGVKIRTVYNGWGFMVKAVVILAKNREDKKLRLAEYEQVKNKIQKDLIDLDWKTTHDRTPIVHIFTESYFKKCYRWL